MQLDGDYRKELAVETSESRELRNYSSQKERGAELLRELKNQEGTCKGN